MTNKDVFKILLCSYGYDRNIKIETYRGDGGFIGYDIYAENKEGDEYHEIACEGFMFHFYMILKYMKEQQQPFKTDWWNISPKYVCDEAQRNILISQWDRRDSDTEKWIIAYKPIEEWHKINNPCPNCTINKKDHWDTTHYNCELNHTHSCKIMIEHYEKKAEMMRQIKTSD
jgi:hypothetical protein